MNTDTNTWEGILIQIVNDTRQGVAKGVDVAMEQMPDLVSQLLLYHGIESAVKTILLIVAFSVPLFLIRKFGARFHEWATEEADGVPYIAVAPITIAWLCISGWQAVGAALTTTKIIIAPKVYLIEYVSTLVK